MKRDASVVACSRQLELEAEGSALFGHWQKLEPNCKDKGITPELTTLAAGLDKELKTAGTKAMNTMALYVVIRDFKKELNASIGACRYAFLKAEASDALAKKEALYAVPSQGVDAAAKAELDKAFAVWKSSAVKAGDAKAKATSMPPSPSPGARVSSWSSLAGLGFAFGLVMVITGSLLFRRALKAELVDAPEGGEAAQDGPKDLGVAFSDLAKRVAALDDAVSTGLDAEAIKSELENIQLDLLEPIVEARQKVQLKYGMEAFAQIYGPLAGAERRLNRAWSALVDDHRPEAHASISRVAKELAALDEQVQSVIAAKAA